MSDVSELVTQYIAAWNETDPAARRAAVDRLWAEGGTYVDPLAVAEGREAIAATIGGVQDHFPGFVFRPGGLVDAHHNLVRFTWELAPSAGAESVVDGFDVAVLTEDGRLRDVHGFLDKVPTV
ncbi:nuclear transport factor 2 family protein [Sphaerisporangium corydalis]|uniref:Nuclear transport factor 2 family protein n=1 Tax=Sphaerisporangium corydalis TaxID=1441875 RepID=A0ABV9EKK1_9ACTN|nr:nuclear transport factor 2 family protein [Sphaerisporangium corydalis]